MRERLIGCLTILIIAMLVVSGKKMDELEQTISSLEAENQRLSEINKELEETLSNHACETTIIVEYAEDVEKRFEDAYNTMLYIEPLKEYDEYLYFETYKKVLEDYSDILDPPETIYDFYSEEEINLMLRCIETETYQCPFIAKVGVACVILNRVESESFPSTAESVIKKPNQFAYGRTKISEDTRLALEYAFEIEDVTNGCIGFRSDINPPYWNGWKYSGYTDGKHFFYEIDVKEVTDK